MSEGKLNFSVRNVPDSWHAAAGDAPKSDGTGPATPSRTRHRLPTGTRPDLVTGALSGLAMTIVAGAAWYLNDINSKFTSGPAVIGFSIAFGALIAIAVRIGAGPAGPEMRVGIGAALYLSGLFLIAFFASRERYSALNRRSPSFQEVEDIVTALYLNDLAAVVGWIVGLGVMGWMTFALKHRRR